MTGKRGLVGPADLLRLLAAAAGTDAPADALCLDVTADTWFGYVRQDQPAPTAPKPRRKAAAAPPPPAPPAPPASGPLRMPAVYAVVAVKPLPAPAGPPRLPAHVRALAPDDARLQPGAARCMVRDVDVCPRARVLPVLKRCLASTLPGVLDERRLVDAVAQQRPLHRWPRLPSRRLQPGLLVLFDFGEALWPYRHDMLRLAHWLRHDAGAHQVLLRCLDAGPWGTWRRWGSPHTNASPTLPQPGHWPAPGGKVLIVSDLGLGAGVSSPLAQSPAAAAWQALLQALVLAGQTVVVLTTQGQSSIPLGVSRRVKAFRWSADSNFKPLPWGATPAAPPDAGALDQLLAMVAATRRTDPALLRALRRLLPSGKANASLEAQVWGHADVVAGGACWIRPGRSRHHLQRFAQLPADVQLQVHHLCAQHHAHLPPVLVHEELLLRHQWGAPALQQALAPGAEVAGQFLRAMLPRIGQPGFAQWTEVAQEMLARIDADDPADVPEPLRELADAVYAGTAAGAVPSWVALERDTLASAAPPRWLVHDIASGQVQLVSQPPHALQRVLHGPLLAHSLDFRRAAGRSRVRVALGPQTGVLNFGLLADLPAAEWRTPSEVIQVDWVARPHGAAGWSCSPQGLVVGLPPAGPAATALQVQLSGQADSVQVVAGPGNRPAWVSTPATASAAAAADGPEGVLLDWVAGIDHFGVLLNMTVMTRNAVAPTRMLEFGPCQTFRYIPPGTFQMGSPPSELDRDDDEGPRHPVTLTQGYWLADTPCTQALWRAVMGGTNPSHFKDAADADDRPVDNVSWDNVQTFLHKLQALLPAGCQAALPTEAEWEHAARAGTHTAYWWGDTADAGKANMGNRVGATTAVKAHPANPWGLHDVHGNVWEWCADDQRLYQDRPEVDPSGGAGGDTRVLRGGAWHFPAGGARSACRGRDHRGFVWTRAGFRLALRSPSTSTSTSTSAAGPGVALPGGQGWGSGRGPDPAAGGSPGPAAPGRPRQNTPSVKPDNKPKR